MKMNFCKLTKEEFEHYLKKAQEGDLDAKKIIVEANLPLVLSISKKFYSQFYDIGDFISTGTIGLIKSIDKFDIEKGYKFSSYAVRCIKNAILEVIIENDNDIVYLEDELSLSGDKIIDLLPSNNTNISLDYDKKIVYKKIRELVMNLSDKDRKIICLYFGFYNDKCYTQQEIAAIFGLSQHTIYYFIEKNILKIKKYLVEHDYIDKPRERKPKKNTFKMKQ